MIVALVARLVFAFAAASALAASMGVAVPQHDERGLPLFHDHVLAAYRFGFLMPATGPGQETSPEMAKLHRVLRAAGVPIDAMWQMPRMDPGERPTTLPTIKTARLSPIQDLAIEFALLVVLGPRLARPIRRLIAELPLPRVPAELWRLTPTLAPPRLVVLP